MSAEARRGHICETAIVQVALAVSPGVSADECEAFTLVFGQLAEFELVRVGAHVGAVGGQGGGARVDAVFDDVLAPAIVLVPGGLGCARTALDDTLLAWLRTVAPRCDWLVASSTGTVVVAAAGLLDHHEAATHWLASPLLESYGSRASTDRVVQIGRVITCEGRITAMHVALLVTLRVLGPDAVQRVRDGLASAEAPARPSPTGLRRWFGERSSAPAHGPRRPRNPQLTAPDVIEFDPPTTTRIGGPRAR